MSQFSNNEMKSHSEHHEAVLVNMSSEEKFGIEQIKTVEAHAHPASKLGNPSAIGFSAFAVGAFVLGVVNTGLLTEIPHVAVGIALGYSAIGQFVCGITDLIIGNTFGATTMLTFSGFFLSYGIMLLPSTGTFQALASKGAEDLENCIGLYMLSFAIPSFFYFVGSLRQPYFVRAILLQVFLTFFLGAISALAGVPVLAKVGGWFSITLAATAWYVTCAILYREQPTIISLPLF
ncbi:GPR1/FUN34/yaaH family-domain-containing protein [Phycomyces nitens]|nr:GPR1/FUN34/yaaH family-domain-containing protein [Phycomyces nitens]